MGKTVFIGFALLFSSVTALAADVVFTDGSTKILVDAKTDKMYCTNCGYGAEMKPIVGPVPMFEGIGSGVENYFKNKGILIVRSDMGVSCLAGQYTVIDLNTRTSKELSLPNCNEAAATYATDKGKAVMRVKQGKKVTTFTF